jgi:hypothetical protein
LWAELGPFVLLIITSPSGLALSCL